MPLIYKDSLPRHGTGYVLGPRGFLDCLCGEIRWGYFGRGITLDLEEVGFEEFNMGGSPDNNCPRKYYKKKQRSGDIVEHLRSDTGAQLKINNSHNYSEEKGWYDWTDFWTGYDEINVSDPTIVSEDYVLENAYYDDPGFVFEDVDCGDSIGAWIDESDDPSYSGFIGDNSVSTIKREVTQPVIVGVFGWTDFEFCTNEYSEDLTTEITLDDLEDELESETSGLTFDDIKEIGTVSSVFVDSSMEGVQIGKYAKYVQAFVFSPKVIFEGDPTDWEKAGSFKITWDVVLRENKTQSYHCSLPSQDEDISWPDEEGSIVSTVSYEETMIWDATLEAFKSDAENIYVIIGDDPDNTYFVENVQIHRLLIPNG